MLNRNPIRSDYFQIKMSTETCLQWVAQSAAPKKRFWGYGGDRKLHVSALAAGKRSEAAGLLTPGAGPGKGLTGELSGSRSSRSLTPTQPAPLQCTCRLWLADSFRVFNILNETGRCTGQPRAGAYYGIPKQRKKVSPCPILLVC